MRFASRSQAPGAEDSSRLKLVRAKTIRSQILLAFLAMSLITASLGFSSVRDLEREGTLVDRTFDRSLMSINFARAAATDFAALQATVVRRLLTKDADSRAGIDRTIATLESTMEDDLSVAVERAQSGRALTAAKRVQQALAAWKRAQQTLTTDTDLTKVWPSVDHQAAIVGQQLDLLINYTAGDGFIYRQIAHATIRTDKAFNTIATILAIVISGSIAWLLSRRVVTPIKKASEIATKIADGNLEVSVPAGNADELGALLAAMEAMRGNIKASMEREVELRRSAQSRLADALESSREGIVVIDADAHIALANLPASMLLEKLGEPLNAGDPAERLIAALPKTESDDAQDLSSVREAELGNGRWLRIARNQTREGGIIFVYSDISLVKKQEAALRTTNLWLDAALTNLSQGLCLFDSTNRLRVFNRRFCDLFGLPIERVRSGMSLDELVDLGFAQNYQGISKEGFLARVERRIALHRPVDQLLEMTNGRTIALSHRPLPEESWLATYEDVTDRRQAEDKIAYMARHDALTGLPNRGFFAERIETALAAVTRGKRFSLLCLDLDRFKEVNDTLGHPIGDELLRKVAARLTSALREADMVARLGGDEFAVIQADTNEAEEAMSLAQRIIDELDAPFDIEGNPVKIGVSIGISLAPADGETYDELLKNADLALYRAKADGRNVWRFFERAMDERQRARRLLELDLREAVAENQFDIEYQPIFEVATDRIIGLEALIRWRHPTRGNVPPAEFIPLAEEMGLITLIGKWVIDRACHDAISWPQDVSLSINVSASQLRNGALIETIRDALEASGLMPGRLLLEITESVLIANEQTALLVLNRFKTMGIRIAMDDFGTGFSSLSYLRSFPFDNVKIDKSFIQDMTTRSDAAAIVRAVIALCACLGMRTTAEGIETADQLAFLKAEGCREAQGFLLGRPLPASKVAELLEIESTAPIQVARPVRAA